LSIFIDFNRGDLKALRRWFFPSKKTLELAGEMLMHEFSELCGENNKNFLGKDLIIKRLQVLQLSEYLPCVKKESSTRSRRTLHSGSII